MARVTDCSQKRSSKYSNRYIPITLKTINKGSASYLAKRIEGGFNEGVTRFQLRAAANAPCYPNYITPVAGIIDSYKKRGATFLPSRSLDAHEYLSHIGLLKPYNNPVGAGDECFLDRI